MYVLEERAADRDRHGLITESTKRSTSSTSPSRSSSRTTSQPPPCRMIARSPPPQCKTCSGGTGPTPSTPSCSCPEAPAACGERRRGRRHVGRAIARRHRRRTPCAAASRRRRCRRRESPTASGSPSASLTRSPSEQAACRWGTACSPAATTAARQAARCRRWNRWRRHRRSADRARRVRRRRRRHVQGGRRHAVNEARQHRRGTKAPPASQLRRKRPPQIIAFFCAHTKHFLVAPVPQQQRKATVSRYPCIGPVLPLVYDGLSRPPPQCTLHVHN